MNRCVKWAVSAIRQEIVGVDEVSVDGDENPGSDEEEAGNRMTKKMADPMKPKAEEIEEHEKTHLPYRSWCRHCVRGRGKEAPHLASKEGPGLPEYHMDYGFFGEEGEPGKTVPVLVVRERSTRMTMAAAVPTKTTRAYIARRVVAFMKEVGNEYGDIVVKSDQEPAITSIVAEVGRVRAAGGGGRYVVENSPVRSSASNGVVERAIQSVAQQTRVFKGALEATRGAKIPSKHYVIPWVVEYAGFLLNRFEVGSDGKTAYERCKGKRAKTSGIEFGEAILWRRRPVGGALAKLTCLWEDGVFSWGARPLGRIHCRRCERSVEDENDPEKAGERKMGGGFGRNGGRSALEDRRPGSED